MAAADILKNRKRAISWPRFDRFRPNLARLRSSALLSRPTVKNLKFEKSKMAAAAILESRKIVVSLTRFERYRPNLAWLRSFALLSRPTVKNFEIWKSKMAAAAILTATILKSRKIAISRPRFDRFRPNLARRHSSALLSRPTVKNLKFKNPRWRRPPSLKIEKSPYIDRNLSDFDDIWHGDAGWPCLASQTLKIWSFKTPRWRRRPSWKIEKLPYLGRDSTDFDDIWQADAVRCSWPFRRLNFQKFKNPSCQRPPFS